jgi:homoserine kinase type II
MGLFTELSLDEAQRLARDYGVEVRSIEPLSGGSVNSNFRLTDVSGLQYFARIYEEQGARGAAAELRLLGELARASVQTVVPCERRDGSSFALFRGKPFALIPWVDGEMLCQKGVTEDHARAVGEALARLHLATPSVTPLEESRFRVDDIRARLDRIEAESPRHRDAALHIRRRLDHYNGRRNAEVPAGVIHGDLFRDNVLFRGGRIAALIDFESASHGPFAFDLMVTILAWCYGDAFDAKLVGAMLSAYERLRPLERAERAILPVEGALACLRFATTRITDFSMRAPPGKRPLRDYRRFLARLEAIEQGVLDPELQNHGS